MRFQREAREFCSFLFGMWGLLAGVSVFLPLANSVWTTLPLQPSNARLATALATLTCFFALIYSFAERHRLRTALRVARRAPFGWEPETAALRAALGRFGWAIACFALYLILEALYDRFTGQRGATVSEPKGEFIELMVRILGPLAAVVYSLLFGLFTGAFAELAMVEYVKERGEEYPRPGAEPPIP